MARPLRLEYEGALYHVTSRGNERGKIFFTESDSRKFLDYVRGAVRKYGIIIHGYVLMTNHYHLLLETPQANLSKAMHHLNGAYTTYINIKRKRSGHLFQGRYKAIIVDRDSYLGELSRYIHLNPVRANLVSKPEEYPYSSYRAYVSGKGDDLVTTDLVFGLVGGGRVDARKRYRVFVEAGLGRELENPADKVYGGMILGKAEFIKETLKRLKGEHAGKTEISHRRALQWAGIGDEILDLVAKSYRVTRDDIAQWRHREAKKVAIYLMKKHTALTNGEIGARLGGLSYPAVAKAFTRLEEEIQENGRLRPIISRLESRMSNVKG